MKPIWVIVITAIILTVVFSVYVLAERYKKVSFTVNEIELSVEGSGCVKTEDLNICWA